MKLLLSTILLSISISTSVTANCLDTLNLSIWKDLTYSTNDNLELQLDLFVSKNSARELDLILLLPGERMSTRADFNCMAGMLAAQGFAVAIIDYRIPPNYSFPKALDDVLDATLWLKSNDKEFDISIKSVGLVGQNFGGYLAALTGITYPMEFQVIASIHGAMDLTTYVSPNNYPYLFHSFLGYPKAQNPAIWEKASPIMNVQRSSPPFIFFHGKEDERIDYQQTLVMDKAIKAIMGDSKVIIIDEAGNGYFNKGVGLQLSVESISKKFKKEFWPMPEEVDVKWDVTYASIGERELKMHIFSPSQAKKPLPAVLFLHGGGGMWGRKENMLRNAAELASYGYISICVEYRLVREKIFPAAMDDVKAAVRWIRENKDELKINGDKIGAVGNSAGAYLAAILGVTPNKNYFNTLIGPADPSSSIQAVVSISGVVDMVGLHPRDPYTTTTVFGVSLVEDPDLYFKSSPTNLVSKEAANFLFIHGTDDELGSLEEVSEMAKKLKTLGIRGDVVVIEKGQHDFWNYENWRSDGMNAMVKFLDETLKAK